MSTKYSEGGKYGSGVTLRGYDTDYSGEKLEEKEKKEPPAKNKKEKKKKKRELKGWKKILAVLAVIAFCLLLTRLPFFNIEYIDVLENRMFTDEDIMKAGEIAAGDNIFDHRESKLKEKISAKIPYITDIQLKRDLPDRVIITVTENDPVLAIPYKNKFLIVDSEGLVVEKTKSPLTATTVQGLEIKSYETGSRPAVGDKTDYEQALRVAVDGNKAGLFFKMIDVTSNLQMTAYVTDTICCIGDGVAIRDNLDGIKALLYDIDLKGYTSGTIYVGEDDYATFSPSR